MMRSLYSGVSGLKNHQTRMDVIGNNISNVNTTGFKSGRVTFADMLSQTLSGASAPRDGYGGTNPKQIGLGSSVSSIDTIFTDGSVQSTGKNTDLCLSGNGLFIVRDKCKPDPNDPNDKNKDDEDPNAEKYTQYYTRNGAFEFDANGDYVLSGSGLYVMGWMATNGKILSRGEGEITKIHIPIGKTMAPQQTTIATYTNNLNSEVPIITEITGGSTRLTLSDGSVDPACKKTYAVGDVYKTITTPHQNAGDTVTVSQSTVPVTVHLADGRTVDGASGNGSDDSTGWRFGYTTTSPDTGSATASATTSVRLKNQSNTLYADPTSGTYTVGEEYTSSLITDDSNPITATNDETNNIIWLYLEDGSKHNISTSNESYTVNKDSYTYTYTDDNGNSYTSTSLVAGYTRGFIIAEMTVTNPAGMDAQIAVNDPDPTKSDHSIASRTLTTPGASITASADNNVTLTLANGNAADGTLGTRYTIDGEYTTPQDQTPDAKTGPAGPSNAVKLYLEDGTEVTDDASGNDYTVGTEYIYTSTAADGSTTTHTTKITGYSLTSTISSITETLAINQIDETESIRVTEVGVTTASDDDPVTVKLSDGTSTVGLTSGQYNIGQSIPYVTILTVYDTGGVAHDVSLYFTKTSAGPGGSDWLVSVNPDGSGTAAITENGKVTTINMPDTTLHFDTNGRLEKGAGEVQLSLINGFNKADVPIDFSSVTQYAGGNTIKGTTNGNSFGSLASVSIDSSGTITGTYTNGIKQTEAQVAIAQFNNAAGLTKTGDSLYQASNNSGAPSILIAQDGGVTITPSALEMSNVDIANEFTDMIITQRGFQANSKIITVSDEMLETLINTKR